MKSLVSVVIPAYNAERFIKESIESCENQTYENVEVIVVNDGSTDDTGYEIEECAGRYSNIKYIDSPHIGKVNAINLGVLHAEGEYIAIHAADDVCLNFRLEAEVEAIDSDDENVLVYGGCYHVDENLRIIKSFTREKKIENSCNYFEKLLYGNVVTGGTILIKRKAAEKIFPIPSQLLFEDWWIAFTASFYGKLVQLSAPLIMYRQHSRNDYASFNISDPGLRAERIKNNFKRHFQYYTEFRKFIEENIYINKEKYLEIIEYNIMLRKLILTRGFFRRKALIKNIYKLKYINIRQKIKLWVYVIFGDKTIYAEQFLRCSAKKIIYCYQEKINAVHLYRK